MTALFHAPTLSKRRAADVTILPFWKEGKKAKPACKMGEFSSAFLAPLRQGDFSGNEGELLLLYPKKKKEKRLLLLGLGEQKASTDEIVRRSYAVACKWCRHKKLKSVNVVLASDFSPTAALEGMLLTNYVFDQLRFEVAKKDPSSLIQKLCLVGIEAAAFQECKKTAKITEAVHFARDLINGNADDVTPEFLAKQALDLQKEFSTVKTTVLDKKKIEKEKLGLLLAVNRASDKEPRLIIVEYRGNPDVSDQTALVGKGITYDTGGLILKPKGGMETMKDDMSAAAAVLGTIKAAAGLRLKVNILGIIISTENSIGPGSYKPGDVYRSYSGKTVEVYDTDAEGRLVVADAVAYVQENYSPSRIIDLGTFTGGAIIALGDEASCLFSNDEKLAAALTRAGEKTFERVWRLPLFPEYREALKSSIADIRNATPERKASSIMAATFIHAFVKKVAWAHIDIAATAYLSSPRRYHTTLATGVGVRLLIEFLSHEI